MATTYGFDGSVDEVAMAKLARFAGVDYGYGDVGDWRVSAVAGAVRTVAIAAGTGYGHFILDELFPADSRQLDAVASGKRWDLIARRRVWTPPGGTSNFYVCKGVAAADPAPVLPATRLRGPGATDDQPLALVQVVAGQDQPAQIINLRYQSSVVYTAENLLSLADAEVGAEAIIGLDRYHLELDSAGLPKWVSPKSAAQTVTTGVITPAAGFVVDSGFVNRCIVDPTGKDVTYEVQLRRTGAAISFGSSGAMSDIQVGSVTGPMPDANLGGFALPVTFRAQGGSSATQTSGVPAWGYLKPDGTLWIESGLPDGFVAKQAAAGKDIWSLLATINFRKA